MTVSDYHPYDPGAASGASAKWWFPAGKYELMEVKVVSEVNFDPLYVPGSIASFRRIGEYRVWAGQVTAFPPGEPPGGPDAWEEGRPPCFGRRDTSVGHGDVHVTLTWQKNVDLDLHVIEPGGTEVYFQNLTSPSGGALDRDNECTQMRVGKPENVFWPVAPHGTYGVKVVYFANCTSQPTGPVAFVLRVLVKGVATSYSRTVVEGGAVGDITFDGP